MADAILLSTETYNHLKKWLDDYGSGLEKTLQLGRGLQLEERGPDYLKIGIDTSSPNAIPSSLTVSDGTNTVSSVTRMNFIGTLFSITAGNGIGVVDINLRTTNCA